MERRDRAAVAAFYAADAAFVVGAAITLGEDVAHHMTVRRMATGEPVHLIDGHGSLADATIVRLARAAATLQVERVHTVAPHPSLHLLVPIADRDRMLWLAEKCAELSLTSWRPVLWKRSRSVKPRGEGPTFTGKVRARMAHALEQSGGAWLPVVYPDATCDRAIAGAPEGARLVLDVSGEPIVGALPAGAPATLAVGPEGGFDPGELETLERAGFRRVRLEGNTLRFETAAIAGLALLRSALHHAQGEHGHGE